MLTFELSKDSDKVEVHGDKVGLERLAKLLKELAAKDSPDHLHLMTKEWGGRDLSEERQGLNNALVHHVKICFWP